MAAPARKPATYEDVLAAPEGTIAQVVDGELIVEPRPSRRHARAATRLGGSLDGPFDRGAGGPGGWVLLDEPELPRRPLTAPARPAPTAPGAVTDVQESARPRRRLLRRASRRGHM